MYEAFCPVVLVYLIAVHYETIREVLESGLTSEAFNGLLRAFLSRVDTDKFRVFLAAFLRTYVLNNKDEIW